MGYGKWIGGVVGFMAMGPLGALAGYAIGALFDKATDAEAQGETGREYYGPTSSGCEDIGQRNSFLFAMLVMASYIIRADGRIMHSEMEFVRRFLRVNFGEGAVAEGEQILLNLFERRKQMERTDPMGFSGEDSAERWKCLPCRDRSTEGGSCSHGTVGEGGRVNAQPAWQFAGRCLQGA